MNLQQLVFWLAILFLAWWVAGAFYNRRRLKELLLAVGRHGTLLGKKMEYRLLGNSAFRVTFHDLRANLAEAQALCLLQPRDFPLAWAWMHLRGHGDQIHLQMTLKDGPKEGAFWEGEGAEKAFSLPGLKLLARQTRPPHFHLILQLRRGPVDPQVEAFFRLAQRVMSQED
ncbi:MAG: hypothetical protein KM310_01975 [Clostridiales bacterium]|nr:hypothetical protein [Clostridiales bacterium]